jgi:hypothetical protein
VHNLFAEYSSAVLLSCDPSVVAQVQGAADEVGAVWPAIFGETIDDRFQILANGMHIVDEPIATLKKSWVTALPSQLAEEVTA